MSPRRATPQHKNQRGFTIWLLIGAVVIVAVIAVVVSADFMIRSQGSTVVITRDRIASASKAPIAFVEFSDFQ